VVDFISDLHLHAGDDPTFLTWQHYLQNTSAQAVFILGDLFEVWVGDDVLALPAHGATSGTGFEARCVDTLRQARERLELFFICGNRDFLLGARGLRASGMQALADPCALQLGSERWLLSHGDALCLEDVDYQRFRTMVRSAEWQAEFLGQPLALRQDTARRLRAQSELHKSTHPVPSTVDTQATMQWLREANAGTLIHGHTHQPADHTLPNGLRRIVLSDWDLRATPARAQVLRLTLGATGEPVDLRRLSPADAC
jgi:UDP-2,3-diacylglucosamine hydrolase